MAEKVNKAYSMLWLIKRNFKDIGAEAFVTLYKHVIRSHLEYNNSSNILREYGHLRQQF